MTDTSPSLQRGIQHDLVLDPFICIWVLLPISVVTFLVSLLRHYLTLISFKPGRKLAYRLRLSSYFAYLMLFRNNGNLLPLDQYILRYSFFMHPENGYLFQPVKVMSITSTFMNPENMSGKVKELMSSALPQMALGAWARYFYSGFAVAKIPFPLSETFRSMLQSGIEMTGKDLDVSYVSALSWYVLNLFGNVVLFKLLLTGFSGNTGATGGQFQPAEHSKQGVKSVQDDPRLMNIAEWHTDLSRSLHEQMTDSAELNLEKQLQGIRDEMKFTMNTSYRYLLPLSEDFLLVQQ
eukprot:CAMPEP_0184698018 /NCGR_PEP_ID=MMETSP0313-20130426/4782_1 /TAXON_ID=2792 /ORGANISM="Porphyridium aerugineum, Strain SAG 1380-2" /LENGTH=292 /DNA_ID=CAMNT_0027156893 /DNA_START=20 /DNA_END=898 /DNA_ORIENTATION=-